MQLGLAVQTRADRLVRERALQAGRLEVKVAVTITGSCTDRERGAGSSWCESYLRRAGVQEPGGEVR